MGYLSIRFHTAVLALCCNACYVHFILIRDELKAKTLTDPTSSIWTGKTITFPEFWNQINTWPALPVLSAKPDMKYVFLLHYILKLTCLAQTWNSQNIHDPVRVPFVQEEFSSSEKFRVYKLNWALEVQWNLQDEGKNAPSLFLLIPGLHFIYMASSTRQVLLLTVFMQQLA